MTIHLIPSEAVANLTLNLHLIPALNPNNSIRICLYTYEDGSMCGVGAMFSDEERKALDGEVDIIQQLIVRELVSVPSGEFGEDLSQVQNDHDNVVHSSPNSYIAYRSIFDATLSNFKEKYS